MHKCDLLPETVEVGSGVWSFSNNEGVLKTGKTVHCLVSSVESMDTSSDEGEFIGVSK